MPNKRQLTIEFPLEVLSECGFPLDLLRMARFLRFLRQDTYGFQITCKVPTAKISAFKKKWEHYEAVARVERLHPVDKDGLETLFVQGRWLRTGGMVNRGQAAKILRSLSKCKRYFSRSPEVVGKKLRVSMEGKQSEIEQLLARLDKLKVPYRIAKPVGADRKANFVLHLAS